MSNRILKIEYREKGFDFDEMRSWLREVTTITSDGKVCVKEYLPKSRKPYIVQEDNISVEKFEILCQKIENCINSADRLNSYIDDSSARLKIFYEYGRTQTVDRGLGNATEDIFGIIDSFIIENDI